MRFTHTNTSVMKVTFFSTQPYDRTFFEEHNKRFGHTIDFFEVSLSEKSVNLIDQSDAVCVFVNDRITKSVIGLLAAKGVKIIALRCAGFNNIDLEAAAQHNIRVVRVPAYSPYAVAEHAVAMIMTLNRKTHKAYNRVRDNNFSLEGFVGFDLFGKTVGVIGTGKIGKVFANIMLGLGCKVICYDKYPDNDWADNFGKLESSKANKSIRYAELTEIFKNSDSSFNF